VKVAVPVVLRGWPLAVVTWAVNSTPLPGVAGSVLDDKAVKVAADSTWTRVAELLRNWLLLSLKVAVIV
jgi:hypothetical protein